MVTNAKIVHCRGDFKTMRDPFRSGHDPEKWDPVFGKDHAQT